MVSELKAKLSGYLAQVRRGATVTVCDRHTPIARLVPFEDDAGGLEIRAPIAAGSLPNAPGVTLGKQIDVVALLRADRDHR
jgi:prevent-host-death family protein